MGLAVAVVKNGKISYTHSFGLKNAETKEPLTKESIFRIASISKSFSATSIMQLVEKKKLSLEDDMSKLVGFKVRNPKFPETVITLRMVLSHRSSINDKEGYFTLDAINPEKNTNWANCYNDYEPGTGYQYCNLNYNMTGTIIEKISGERFDQYVKKHILDPLGLYGGYCVDSLDASRFATIYEYNDSLKQLVASPGAYAPRSQEIANCYHIFVMQPFSPHRLSPAPPICSASTTPVSPSVLINSATLPPASASSPALRCLQLRSPIISLPAILITVVASLPPKNI